MSTPPTLLMEHGTPLPSELTSEQLSIQYYPQIWQYVSAFCATYFRRICLSPAVYPQQDDFERCVDRLVYDDGHIKDDMTGHNERQNSGYDTWGNGPQ